MSEGAAQAFDAGSETPMRLIHRQPSPAELETVAVLSQLAAHSAANAALAARRAHLDAEVDELVAQAALVLPGPSYGRFLALAYAYPAPDPGQVREALHWEINQLRRAQRGLPPSGQSAAS